MTTLRLKFLPCPEHAMDFARQFVRAARELSQLELDFSRESLHDVDALIETWRESGATSGDMAETLFTIGCYVGEVMRFELGGSWIPREDAPAPFDQIA